MPDIPEPTIRPEEVASNSEEESSPEPELREYQEYRSVAPTAQEPTNVIQAIHTAAPDRIYTLLLEIVTIVPAAKTLAEERLLVPVTSTAEASVQPNLKRKAYEMCANCDEEYSVENNCKGHCVYHPGRKEQDDSSSAWDDDYGEMGSPENLVDHPDYQHGFKWDCCDQKVFEEGCVVSKHVPKEDAVAKKMRPALASVSANINGAASFRGPGGRAVIDL